MINVEQMLFEELLKLAASKSLPPRAVWGASVNLLVNVVVQSTAERKTAETILEQLMRNVKLMLDVHYDPATGKRRQVHPFTQIIEAPFHQNESVIFHGS